MPETKLTYKQLTEDLPKKVPEEVRKMLVTALFTPTISEEHLYRALRRELKGEEDLSVKVLARRVIMFREGDIFDNIRADSNGDPLISKDFGTRALVNLFSDGIQENQSYKDGLEMLMRTTP